MLRAGASSRCAGTPERVECKTPSHTKKTIRIAVNCYDLVDVRSFTTKPDNILASRYFYEEDPTDPDNRVENALAKMEAETSASFDALSRIDFSDLRSDDKRGHSTRVTKVLTAEVCKAIKTFANFQYFRVRGAIEQKRFELQPSPLGSEEREYHFNPGRFVESGTAYARDKFEALKMMVFLSQKEDFITSDWPCFDMKESNMAPTLGVELGNEPGVICYIPLAPRMAAAFFPQSHAPEARFLPEGTALVVSPAEVRNMNTLVIQQAERYVVTRKASDYVFKVAAKRKKASAIWHR